MQDRAGKHRFIAPLVPPRRQLERAHGSVAASASQLKQLQADVVGRDGEISKLRKELEGIRKKLHAAQV